MITKNIIKTYVEIAMSKPCAANHKGLSNRLKLTTSVLSLVLCYTNISAAMDINEDYQKSPYPSPIAFTGENEQEGFEKRAASFLNGITAQRAREDILSIVKGIQVNDLESFEQFVIPFISDKYKRAKTLKKLKDVEPHDREDFKKFAMPFLNCNKAGHYKIMSALLAIPTNLRQGFEQFATPFMFNIDQSEFYVRVGIFKALTNIPINERESFLQNVMPLIKNISEVSYRSEILKILESVPAIEREGFVQIVPLLNEITDEFMRFDLLKILRDVPAVERGIFIQELSVKSNNRPTAKVEESLNGVKITNIDRLGVAIEQEREAQHHLANFNYHLAFGENTNTDFRSTSNTTLLINENLSLRERAHILQVLHSVPTTERENFVQIAISVVNGITDEWTRLEILRILRDVPAHERQDFAKIIPNTLKDKHVGTAMLHALKSIPSNERDNFIRVTTFFMEGISGESDRHTVLKLLEKIPSHELEGFAQCSSSLLKGVTNGTDRVYILNIFKDVPAHERESFIRIANPFITTTTDGLVRGSIFSALKDVPVTNREGFEQFSTFFNDLVWGQHKVVSVLKDIPVCERDSFVKISTPLINDITCGNKRAEILEIIKDIPVHEREVFARNAFNFMNGNTDVDKRIAMLRSLKGIPTFECEAFAKKAFSLMLDNTNLKERIFILGALNGIPIDELDEFVQIVSPLLNGITWLTERGDIIELFKECKAQEREGLMKMIASLMINFNNVDERSNIVHLLQGIPTHEREGFAQSSSLLLKNITDIEARTHILWILKEISANERESFAQTASPLLGDIADRDTCIDRVRLLKSIPINEREDFAKSGNIGLLEKESLYEILKTIDKIPADERTNFIRIVTPLLNGFTNQNSHNYILGIVKNIPANERESFGKNASSLIENITDGKKRWNILEFLKNIPANEREAFSQSASPLIKGIGDIWEILSILQFVKDDIPVHEREAFTRSAGIFVKDLTNGVTRTSWLLTLKEIPLQELQALKNKRAVPIDLGALKIPQEIDSFKMGDKDIVMSMSLNPFYLKDLPKQGTKFNDLPLYSKSFLTDMMTALALRKSENNILFLSEVEAIADFTAEDKINVSGDATIYDYLIQGSLGSSYLQNLLNVTGNPSDIVSTTASKFIACVSYLSTLPNEREPGKFFSLREKSFIKMLRLLHSPTIEKDEKISFYYNNLPQEAKFKQVVDHERNKSKGKAILDTILSQEVEKMFSINRFLEHLIEKKIDTNLERLSHRAQYIKSLIGPEVGLCHMLAFDSNTSTFVPAELNMDKQKVLQAFYYHFKPTILVSSVVNEVNALLKTPNSNYQNLLSELMEPEFKEVAWGFSTLTDNISITELGAIHLLKQIGAFK